MKLLAFVDMHGSLKALRSIEKKAKKADLLVCAGDLTIFEQGMGYLLHELDKLGKPVHCLKTPFLSTKGHTR